MTRAAGRVSPNAVPNQAVQEPGFTPDLKMAWLICDVEGGWDASPYPDDDEVKARHEEALATPKNFWSLPGHFDAAGEP